MRRARWLRCRPRVAAQTAAPANPGPVLDIAEWSYLWYGVEHALLARGTVCNGMQMYVEHWIPAQVRHPYPVVLIHGGYGQGSDWISTPDGRRGWATLFWNRAIRSTWSTGPARAAILITRLSTATSTGKRRRSNVWRRAWRVAQWPGTGDANDPAVAQLVASMGQPMGNNPITQNVWRTRGAILAG